VRAFLRIDGDDFALRGARLVWYQARCEEAEGIAFQLVTHGSKNLLHVAGWAPGFTPAHLSGAEVTVTDAGPDAALDGRLFGMLLIRFGRVDANRAIISVDGDIEGIEPGSQARSHVAADIDAAVIAATVPAFCNRCGRSLADEAEEVAEIVAGRLVVGSRPRPTCRSCATTQTELAPPQRCSTCGEEYDPAGVDWQSDEHSVAYNCTCPQGHTVAGTTTLAA
jgi:hypothetical protein